MSLTPLVSFSCVLCGKTGFASLKALGGHKATCQKGTKTCPVCLRQTEAGAFSRHLRSHDKDHPCPNCGLTVHGDKVFCGSSCSATYNNTGAHRKRQPPLGDCLHCSKPLPRSHMKYCSCACQHAYDKQRRYLAVQATGDIQAGWKGSPGIRQYVTQRDGAVCSICKGTSWRGQPIPLVMDHIDGNSSNWSENNLRLVCGNCDMQLPTYKNKNKGQGRHKRRARYQQGQSY